MSTKGASALIVVIISAFIAYLLGWGRLIGRPAPFTVLGAPAPANAQTIELSTTTPLTPDPDLPPILVRACSCESWGDPNKVPRQFLPDGSILWGQETDPKTGKTIIVKRDVGACQINTSVWLVSSTEQGYDIINSTSSNEAWALHLYNDFGMAPWSASKSCWK